MSEQNKNSYRVKINEILELLEESELDALIVPHDDEYLSYELNEDQERLKFLTGFSGSAGYAIIARPSAEKNLDKGLKILNSHGEILAKTTKNCAIFVDGRYVVQVKEQVDDELFLLCDIKNSSFRKLF